MDSELRVDGEWSATTDHEVYTAKGSLEEGLPLSVVRVSIARMVGYDLSRVLGVACVRKLVEDHAQETARALAVEAHAQQLGHPAMSDLEKRIVGEMEGPFLLGLFLRPADLAPRLGVEESRVREALEELKQRRLKGSALVGWEVARPEHFRLTEAGLEVAQVLRLRSSGPRAGV